MMKLRINPLVVADLKKIRNFIAEDSVEKASETIDKIYGKFKIYNYFLIWAMLFLNVLVSERIIGMQFGMIM